MNMYTLILHYFVGSEFKTEIKIYRTAEEALARVKEVKATGIEISKSHYGIYKENYGGLVKLTEEHVNLV